MPPSVSNQPMSLFEISGRAMSAQLVRLNTTASNLANAGAVSGSRESAYRALRPIFQVHTDRPGVATVTAGNIVRADVEPTMRHDPEHPLADANGNVWVAGVDQAAEMIEMVEASRQYQNNVQVLQTAKTLTLDTLRLGQ